MVPVRIREFQPADAEATLQICRRAIAGTAAAHYEKRQIEAWLPEPDPTAWLAGLTGTVRIAVTAIGPTGHTATTEAKPTGFAELRGAHIEKLFVDPDAGRLGVATTLITDLVKTAVSDGRPAVTVDASETLRPLLLRLGFEELRGQDVARSGVTLRNYSMRLELRPTG